MTFVVQRLIYKKLAWLNELPEDEAVYVFTECSGSDDWARSMAQARPFPMLEQLYLRARDLWPFEDFGRVEKGLNTLLER
ncbi:MAG: hypothetical protein JNL64_13585 [Blastocatellia bacterium]|jgi:hypothetical protein|nr:hypothetical protein [Blastocatellia bacterium]